MVARYRSRLWRPATAVSIDSCLCFLLRSTAQTKIYARANLKSCYIFSLTS
jgi:hypothetical protein